VCVCEGGSSGLGWAGQTDVANSVLHCAHSHNTHTPPRENRRLAHHIFINALDAHPLAHPLPHFIFTLTYLFQPTHLTACCCPLLSLFPFPSPSSTLHCHFYFNYTCTLHCSCFLDCPLFFSCTHPPLTNRR
jgi:hypothetical protein